MKNLFRSKIIRAHLAIGALIALLAPLTVLDDLPLLASVTGLFKALFPPIAAYAAKSKFPQVSELYFAWMWLFSPVYFTYGFKEMRNSASLNAWIPVKLTEYFSVSFVAFLFLIDAIFAFFFNPGYDFNLLPINSSRVVLAWGGSLLSGAAAGYLLGLGIVLVYCVFNKIRQSFTVKE